MVTSRKGEQMTREEKIWVIMSKDRKVIAKGTPRNRYLVHLFDTKNRLRYLTYTSKAMAESAFKNNFFYYRDESGSRLAPCPCPYTENDLEAVEAKFILEIPDA